MTKTILAALLFSALSTSALAQSIKEPIYFGLATRGYSYPDKAKKPVTVITTQKRIKDPLYFRFAKGNG